MSYKASSPAMAAVSRLLPPPALKEFIDAANAAEVGGLEHNDCMKYAWAEVEKGWNKPDKRGDAWSRKKDVSKDVRPSSIEMQIVKVSDELRLVFGWASVITENDEPVVDTQGDIIPPDVLLEATTEFMKDVRVAKAMHKGEGIGEVLHSFPLTSDISKSLGINLNGREGWIVGVKVHSDKVWKRVKSGELKAFSIAGRAAYKEVEAA